MPTMRNPVAPTGRETPRRRAKLFWTGRSQAVRLPKEFRFSAEEVEIRREGEQVILEPVTLPRDAGGWPVAWWQLAGAEPSFDLGDRRAVHERNDVLGSRR